LQSPDRPKGENRTAQAFRPGNVPKEDRPERAADCRALFPKKSFVESKSMAFQKLTNFFPVRKSAVMFGLIGNVGANSLYLRLGWQLRFFKHSPYTRRFRSEFPQNAGTAADLSSRRPHAQIGAKGTGHWHFVTSLMYVLGLIPIRPSFQDDSLCTWFPGLKAWAILCSAAADWNTHKKMSKLHQQTRSICLRAC
jgi:hypothetical protein